MNLADQIADAEAILAALRRQAGSATCAEIGHDWRISGGKNAGCCDDCCCSVPVHCCARCGASDYGDTADADRIRADCAATSGT